MAVVNYLSAENLAAAGITREELYAIRRDFRQKSREYEQAAQTITNILLKTPGVHSARYRVKNSMHLAEKIVRKRLENKDRIINVSNYEQEITDLAGIRVLHLFKSDWRRIHRFISETWELHESPTAYFRDGDSEVLLEMLRQQGCEVRKHKAGYRSVHYIAETSPTKAKRLVEVQVRTIFEEGWSEIDHKLRYPNFSDNPLTNNLLLILNRLAGSADEMSSFIQDLRSHLIATQREAERSRREHDEKVKDMQRIIDELNLSAPDKSKLKDAAESLEDSINKREFFQPNTSWMDWLNKHIDNIGQGQVFDPAAGPSSMLNYYISESFNNIDPNKPGEESEDSEDDDEPYVEV